MVKTPLKATAAGYAKVAVRSAISDILVDARDAGVNPKKGREALKWISTKARQLRIDHSEAMQSQESSRYRNKTQLGIGRMLMFFYDPKYKKTLPYYDRFPCIFILNIYSDSMLGLNLHYLQPTLRAKLMNELYKVENGKYGNRKKLQISWDILKSFANFPLAQPCVKKYLFNHIRSKIVMVPYDEWNIMAFLPTASWAKKSQNEVWKDSRRIIEKKR